MIARPSEYATGVPQAGVHFAGLSRDRLRQVRDGFATRGVIGHEAIAQSLRRAGVTHVFGVAGAPVYETHAACVRAGLRVIGCRHQFGCVVASAAMNYAAGSLRAAAMVSAGPGITNTATGLVYAQENCLPALVIGGRRFAASKQAGEFQAFDAIPSLAPLAKSVEAVRDRAGLAAQIERAVALTNHGRPGPVFLEISEEILNGTAQEISTSHAVAEPPPLDENSIEHAADLLLRAERPIVILGRGARWNEAYKAARVLIEEFRLPAITSPMAAGLLPHDHPLLFTSVARAAQNGADFALVVGARMNWQFKFGAELAEGAKVAAIDIDEAELRSNLTPEAGLAGDARRILTRLIEVAREKTKSTGAARSRESWIARLGAARAEASARLERQIASDRNGFSHQRLMWELRNALPADAITVLDGNHCMLVAQSILRGGSPASRIDAGTNGTMGVGLPAAIGAKLQDPSRPVLALCGDFAFGISAMEFETAVRHHVPVVALVVENGGTTAGTVQSSLLRKTDELVCGVAPGCRYDRLAEALGGRGEFLSEPNQVRDALDRAFCADIPTILHVRIREEFSS